MSESEIVLGNRIDFNAGLSPNTPDDGNSISFSPQKQKVISLAVSVSNASPFIKTLHWKIVEEKYTLQRNPRKNIVAAATIHIVSTYKLCNASFKSIEVLPQRILTNPSEGVLNNRADNLEGNLVCRVHDKLKNGESSFTTLDLLGTGTFGQVFRCKRDGTNELVAVKVIKNKPAYHTQGLLEIKIAKLLNTNYDPNNDKHIVRLLESFVYLEHICLVFELLSMSLLDLLTQNQFRGLPLSLVQRFTKQILVSLSTLEDANIIHCDLKPENILIVPSQSQNLRRKEQKGIESKTADDTNSIDDSKSKSEQDMKKNEPRRSSASLSDIKVIDFGSACFEGRTVYSYIQSRFYRSPEVLLGAPYTGAIDMWSLACVCVEMYLGLPLFPGVSQHNQLTRIVEMMGVPPDFLVESKNGPRYFTRVSPNTPNPNSPNSDQESQTAPKAQLENSLSSSSKYRIKTAEEYAAETNTDVPTLKKYLRYNRLDEIIMKCSLPNKTKMTVEQRNSEMLKRESFLDFLQGLFKLNPFERWTAKQALGHPFIKNTPFTGPYSPPADLKMQERKLMFMVQVQQRQTANEDIAKQSIPVKPIRAPTNFGNPQPLQYSQRRLSEPMDPAAAKTKLFDGAERPLLKRGDPVHAKAPASIPSAADGPSVDSERLSDTSIRGDADSAGKITPNSEDTTPVKYSAESPGSRGSDSREDFRANTISRSRSGSLGGSKGSHNSHKPKQRNSFSKANDSAPYHHQHQHQHQHQQQMAQSLQLNPDMNMRSMPIPVMSQPPIPFNNGPYMAMSPSQFVPMAGSLPIGMHPPQMAGSLPIPLPIPMTAPMPVGAVPIPGQQYPPPPFAAMPPPPGWYPSPSMLMPSMIPQLMPFGSPQSGNFMYAPPPPLIPAPMEQFYVGSLGASGGIASSYGGPSSLGVFAGTSIHDGKQATVTDFGKALMRPELDEQRRLMSNNYPQSGQYWQHNQHPGTHYPANPHGSTAPHIQSPIMPSIPIAQSYDSRVMPHRSSQHSKPDSNRNKRDQNEPHRNGPANSSQPSHVSRNNRRSSGEGDSQAQPGAAGQQRLRSDSLDGNSVSSGQDQAPAHNHGSSNQKGKGSHNKDGKIEEAVADWDPFFESADD